MGCPIHHSTTPNNTCNCMEVTMSETLREKLLSVIPQEEVWRVQNQITTWLQTVACGADDAEHADFRQMLITLVDEP